LIRKSDLKRFDEGIKYTNNYFETETQVGWYTRADGKRKPVRAETISGLPGMDAYSWVNTEVSATGIERLLQGVVLSAEGGVYAGDVSLVVHAGFISLLIDEGIGAGAQAMLKYLKSTDAWT
jgi:hypothetical protein